MSQHQLDRHLLSLLVCPISKQALLPANDKQGQLVAESLAAGGLGAAEATNYLITANQRWAYPVRDGVPYLRERDRISLKK